MKITLVLLACLAASLAGGSSARAADAYKPTQLESYALEFVEQNDNDTGLDLYLVGKIGLAKGSTADTAVRASVKSMFAAKASGYIPGKRAFWDAVKTPAVDAPPPPKTDASTQAGKPAQTEKEAATTLWQNGREALAAMPRNQRDVYLRYNLRPLSQPVRTDEKAKEPVEAAVRMVVENFTFADVDTRTSPLISAPTPVQVVNGETAETAAAKTEQARLSYETDRVLVRVGYDKIAAAKKALNESVSEEQQKAVKSYGRAVVDTPPAQDLDATLRSRGLAFTAGMGAILGRSGGSDVGAGTLMARWNLVQRRATARWNQRVGRASPDGDTQVPYFGRIEYAVPHVRGVSSIPYPVERDQKGVVIDMLLDPTFLGLFVGGTAVGEKFAVPGGKPGEEERPYLVGASVGYSYFREAAPLIYFDFGWTVSPSRGFKGSSNYIGVSFDGIVLERLLKGIRGRNTLAAPATTP